jgi:hypothetical protein
VVVTGMAWRRLHCWGLVMWGAVSSLKQSCTYHVFSL